MANYSWIDAKNLTAKNRAWEAQSTAEAATWGDKADSDLGFTTPSPTNDATSATWWRKAAEYANKVAEIAHDYAVGHPGYEDVDLMNPAIPWPGPASVYNVGIPLRAGARAKLYVVLAKEREKKAQLIENSQKPQLSGISQASLFADAIAKQTQLLKKEVEYSNKGTESAIAAGTATDWGLNQNAGFNYKLAAQVALELAKIKPTLAKLFPNSPQLAQLDVPQTGPWIGTKIALQRYVLWASLSQDHYAASKEMGGPDGDPSPGILPGIGGPQSGAPGQIPGIQNPTPGTPPNSGIPPIDTYPPGIDPATGLPYPGGASPGNQSPGSVTPIGPVNPPNSVSPAPAPSGPNPNAFPAPPPTAHYDPQTGLWYDPTTATWYDHSGKPVFTRNPGGVVLGPGGVLGTPIGDAEPSPGLSPAASVLGLGLALVGLYFGWKVVNA